MQVARQRPAALPLRRAIILFPVSVVRYTGAPHRLATTRSIDPVQFSRDKSRTFCPGHPKNNEKNNNTINTEMLESPHLLHFFFSQNQDTKLKLDLDLSTFCVLVQYESDSST